MLQDIRKKISAILVSSMLFASFMSSFAFADSASESKNALNDIDGSYAKKEIISLVNAGIIAGYEDGTFKPGEAMTRAQLAKVLVLSLGIEQDTSSAKVFQDVPSSSWYAGYVGALVKLGITQGSSPTSFSPNASVSREELAVLFIRALKLEDTAKKATFDLNLVDINEVALWAKPHVSLAYQIGLIKGISDKDGVRFAPQAKADRQALARLVYEVKNNQAKYIEKAKLQDKDTSTTKPAPNKENDKTTPPPTSNTGSAGNGGSTGGSGGSGGGGGGGNNGGQPPVTGAYIINQAGTYTLGQLNRNVEILAGKVILKDTKINGNLLLSKSVGDAPVVLDHVEVTGTITVNGGGILENEIVLKDSKINKVVVFKENGLMSLSAEGSTNVDHLTLQSGANIIEYSISEGSTGYKNIVIERKGTYMLHVNIDEMDVKAEDSIIMFGGGSKVHLLHISKTATGNLFGFDPNTTVEKLVVNGDYTSIVGPVSIRYAEVDAEHTNFNGNDPVVILDKSVTNVVYNTEDVLLTTIGSTHQIALAAKYKNGSTRDVTKLGVWNTADPGVATVSKGLVTAKREGQTLIKGEYSGYTVTIPVKVEVIDGVPQLKSISLERDTIHLSFNQSVAANVYDDLEVIGIVNGEPQELKILSRSKDELTLVSPYSNDKLYGKMLHINVKAKSGSQLAAGSQSVSVLLSAIAGRVTEMDGAAVPGLEIRFRDGKYDDPKNGEFVATVTTDQNGYFFVNLPSGLYVGEYGGEGTDFVTSYVECYVPDNRFEDNISAKASRR
ncbi:S-layer homology domain-containing protein [Paenibacillus guangzhouensis]|uniref:S-layer homology domain-containing protein n=1 Tax=Paenibacillus guangzhouensis TaxID=1473112 RepID=UPI0012672B76|nr:S-layer homology domain-containing protein [Paenibacillus guangzhouensis]